MTKRTRSVIIYFLMFLFTAVLLSSTRFFFMSKDFGHDAGIFAYIGFAITKGKALYLEAWDNKGPLLYLINALGIFINHRYGILLLEFITLMSSVIILYKTANLFVSKEISVVCAIFSMMSLTTNLEGGNLAEEYALPFTILGFYFIAKYLKNGLSLKKYEMILTGMCIGAVFLIRLNILAFLGCAVIGVVTVLVKKKEYKKLRDVFLFALLGMVIFIVPFAIYLAYRGILKACIDIAYFQVLGTFSDITLTERCLNVLDMVLETAKSGTVFIAICFVFFFLISLKTSKKEDESFVWLSWITIAGLITTFLANSMSGARHLHYFISFVPVMIIPAVAFSKAITGFIEKNYTGKRKKDDFKAIAFAALMLAISLPGLTNLMLTVYRDMDSESTVNYAYYTEQINNYILENTTGDDTIEVIGYKSAITSYYNTKRLAASNYFYFANGRFSERSKTEFATKIREDVMKNHPKLIMFEKISNEDGVPKHTDFVDHCGDIDGWNAFLDENYVIVDNNFNYIVYKHN